MTRPFEDESPFSAFEEEPEPEGREQVIDKTRFDAPVNAGRKPHRGDTNGERFPPDAHRPLPAAPDAEQGVLCSILRDPALAMGICRQKKVTHEQFHIPAHADIYRTLAGMNDRNEPIETITLMQRLHDTNNLESVGGPAFVSELYMFVPTAANLEYYLGILLEKWTLREQIRICTRIAGRCYDEQDNVGGLLDDAEKDVLSVRARLTESKIVTSRDAVIAAIEELNQQYENRGKLVGLSTGFTEFDELTGGLRNADMIVIAARPSNGKTALAMTIAEHIAIDKKLPVGVFSVEMSTKSLMMRLLSSRAKINLVKWRQGEQTERDFQAITRAGNEIAEAGIYIDDTSAISIQELRGKARIMVQRYGIKALFIDYLQLLRSTTRRREANDQQELTEVSAGVKSLAKELDIPIVVLAQIKRDFDERALTERPRLSDLRGSGSIEQDADLVGFIVREELYAKTTEEAKELEGRATLTVAKQRNGPLGDVYLTFLKQFTRFENRAYGEEPDQGQLL